MANCRIFLAASFCSAVLLATTLPYKLDLTPAGLSITETAAFAKNGGGSGGGNGGNGGNSGGNSGGNGGGNGSGNGKGSANDSRSGGNSKASRASKDAVDDEGDSETGIRHKGGITEQVRKGRYIMKDARGRTIINRRATAADKQRMQTFAH